MSKQPLPPRYRAWMELCLKHGCTGGMDDDSDLIPHTVGVPAQVAWSSVHGRGLRATTAQTAGTCLGMIYNAVGHRTKLLGRYLNHSESPNLVAVVNPGGIYGVLQRDVLRHEEYTICYLDLTTKALNLPLYREYFAHHLPQGDNT